MSYAMNREKGLFVAICGPNGVGKTRVVDELETLLKDDGRGVVRYKFPNYDPVRIDIDYGDLNNDWPVIALPRRLGRELNALVHGGFRIASTTFPRKFQQLNFVDKMETWDGYDLGGGMGCDLAGGAVVIAEGWLAESLVYGRLSGVDRDDLLKMNEQLPLPDLTFILLGTIYVAARVSGHMFESTRPEVIDRETALYREEAAMNGWTDIETTGKDPKKIASEIRERFPEYLRKSVLPF